MNERERTTRTLFGRARRSPLGSVSSLLSSRTELRFSTHSGSTSPSKIIHWRFDNSPRRLSMILRRMCVNKPSVHSPVEKNNLDLAVPTRDKPTCILVHVSVEVVFRYGFGIDDVCLSVRILDAIQCREQHAPGRCFPYDRRCRFTANTHRFHAPQLVGPTSMRP